MLLVNSLLGSEQPVSGGFALTDLWCSLVLNPSLPTLSLLPFDVSLCVICVCAAEGKLQVTTGNSILLFLPLFFLSPSSFFSRPLEECIPCVCLIFGSVVLCWLGVILLVTAVSSQASSRMSMRRL